METSLGAAMLLRPLFPRPFPPGSGESVNLGNDVFCLCLFCLFLCLVVVFAFVFILVCDPWERKCSVWAEDVILTKSDEGKWSDLKAWFFWRGRPEVDRQNSDMSIVDVEEDAEDAEEKRCERNFSFGTILFLATNYIFDLSIKEIHEWSENNPTNIKRYWKKLMTIDCDWRNLNCWVKSWLYIVRDLRE